MFFDPDYSYRSMGTFSALYEMNWMRERGLRYYYLGLFVEKCLHLNYKSRFYPNQRLVNGDWFHYANSSIDNDNALRL